MAAVVRAFAGYFFLVFVVRGVGRRPGKQMTPFEFVLIFFIGGLALTAIVGDEVSFTNAICQIVTIGFAHYTLAWARSKSQSFARLVDGTPLILLEHKTWRTHSLRRMRITDDDVMASRPGLRAQDAGTGGSRCIRAQRRNLYFSAAKQLFRSLESSDGNKLIFSTGRRIRFQGQRRS